ncbi:MAG: head completion/stabilization protein [Candidatus Sedimenticola sp. (ex Thyasira tokunagai)]
MMPGFIATGNDADNTRDQVVGNIAFYPDIDVANFVELYRIDTTISDERVVAALQGAVISTNHDLAEWCIAQKLEGVADIAEVEADQYDDISALVTHYLTAVYSKAKAELIEKYRDFDSTGSGHGRADELTTSMDDHRANALRAIRAITGSEWAGLI